MMHFTSGLKVWVCLHGRRLLASTRQLTLTQCLSSLCQREPYTPVPSKQSRSLLQQLLHGVRGKETTSAAGSDIQPLDHSAYGSDPGPLATKDSLPVPFELYNVVHVHLKRKFNFYLAFGIVFFAAAFGLALCDDVFIIESLKAPLSYRNRKKYKGNDFSPITSVDNKTSSIPVDEIAGDATSQHDLQGLPIRGRLLDDIDRTFEEDLRDKDTLSATERNEREIKLKTPPAFASLPKEIPYLIVGAGSAAYYAALTIRGRDPLAKILIIGEEAELPYDRSALSRSLWWSGIDDASKTLLYRTTRGRKQSVYIETSGFYIPSDEIELCEHGGISLAASCHVSRIDSDGHIAYLDDGTSIKYGKCLIATGGISKKLRVIEECDDEVKKKCMYFRTIDDFKKLYKIASGCRSVTIIGGGILATELVHALNVRYGMTGLVIKQVLPSGCLANLLPSHVSERLMAELQSNGINVFSGLDIVSITKNYHCGGLNLKLSSNEILQTDLIVAGLGVDANTELAACSGLETDEVNGGYKADAELRLLSDLWVAGAACSFYDFKLGRRRLEYPRNSEATGRLAGLNMTGGKKAYWHQPEFLLIASPNITFMGLGRTDPSLSTVSVFSTNADITSKEPRGVVFYLEHKVIVGVVLLNVFGFGPDVARRLIADARRHEDFKEIAKLFDLHKSHPENS